MIIILAILAATRASPLGLPSPPFVSRDQSQAPSCSDPDGCRSLWDIIRSCVLTILLCTWASVHPNVPSPDERWPRIAVRRVGLMLAALIIPEAIIAWAFRQRLAAVELAEKHKGEGWTVTHGFFAIMGGFMEYEGNQPIRVLFPQQLESYSLTGNGDFPRISKADIDDKSKGDTISKGVVILQTSWFVTQCIARGVQGLPITELELITVAFATLNFVIYLLWWEKPLNVQRGVRVYKKRRTEPPTDDGDVEAVVGFWVGLGDALSEVPSAIVRGPFSDHPDLPLVWLIRVLLWPLLKPFEIMGVDSLDQEYENLNLKRVPSFYPDEWVQRSFRGQFLLVAIASAFGGIHCVGWSFTFPSNLERILWRIASVSIVGIPILITPFSFGLSHTPDDSGVENLLALTWMLLPVIYTFSRLVLLVLPFLCLRSLPPAAYQVVHWASFIPHV